jgi:hypothetical protein
LVCNRLAGKKAVKLSKTLKKIPSAFIYFFETAIKKIIIIIIIKERRSCYSYLMIVELLSRKIIESKNMGDLIVCTSVEYTF